MSCFNRIQLTPLSLVLGLLAGWSAWPASVAAQGRCTLPAGAAAAAQELSLRDVVTLLAHEGCSGGAVVSAKENKQHLGLVESVRAKAERPVDATEAFSARTDWQISQQPSGLVLLTPATRQICQSILERRLSHVNYTGKAVEMESALDRLLRGLEPLPSGKVPIVGAGGKPDPSKPSIWEYPVSLNLVDTTAEEVLNETVRQVPGLFWVLREHLSPDGQGSCDLILASEDSSLQGGQDLLPHQASVGK